MPRYVRVLGTALLLVGLAPAAAWAQQAVGFHLGGLALRGLDSRPDSDVLVSNIFNGEDSLDIGIGDFSGASLGMEWLAAVGEHAEMGLGVGFYRRTVPSVYAFLVEDNGSEIEQDLRLRIVPFSATIRFLPFGRYAALQPYVGAGVGVLSWRYSEVGEFVDSFDGTIFQGRFAASGSSVGPLIIGGLRFPLGNGTIGGEVRYQAAEGDLPPGEFVGSSIDLGGFHYLLTFTVGF